MASGPCFACLSKKIPTLGNTKCHLTSSMEKYASQLFLAQPQAKSHINCTTVQTICSFSCHSACLSSNCQQLKLLAQETQPKKQQHGRQINSTNCGDDASTSVEGRVCKLSKCPCGLSHPVSVCVCVCARVCMRTRVL